ncbi:MAG: porin [Planctomycetaceae bacterium]|jgi:hypothetical protein|nr:porin [Planctomycetaceae bacterium]
MYKKIIFTLLLLVCTTCYNSISNQISGNEITEITEISDNFSSPITTPLYTNTVVETNGNNNVNDENNNNTNDHNNESDHNNNRNKNHKLRPRYNITPNLDNRIELVSAQEVKPSSETQSGKGAGFNSSQNNLTVPNSLSNSLSNYSSSLGSVPLNSPLTIAQVPVPIPSIPNNHANNLTGTAAPLELPELSTELSASASSNMFAQDNQHYAISPLEIPQTPDCNNNYSYNKFIDQYTGYFFGNKNHKFRQLNNNSSDGIFCNGWIEGGIFLNADSPDSKENSLIQYNDRDREIIMNQLYISFGRKLTYRRNWFEIGGQIDLLFGTDYFYTSALGLETRRASYIAEGNAIYPEEAAAHWNAPHGKRRGNSAALYGLSLPQAYGEIRLPVSWNATIKAGHFYANCGIESAAAAQNFFYTHSYSFMFGQPTTLTGAMFNAEIPTNYRTLRNRQMLMFGITQGWDMFDKQGGLNYIIGFKSISRKNSQNYISFITQIGKQAESDSNSRISYTLTINRQLTERLTDSWEHNFGYEKNGAVEYLSTQKEKFGESRWISIAKYLTYDINSNLSIGLRAEWFRDNGLARIQKASIDSLLFYYTGKNYYEITLGANWKPSPNITIRPELRFDWSDVRIYSHFPLTRPKNGIYNGNNNMTSFAVDAVIKF